MIDVQAARFAGLDRHALGQVQLDGNVDRFMVVEIDLEGDAVLARFLVGHQVELVDFEPGDQGHHDGVGVARVVRDDQVELEAVFEGEGGGARPCTSSTRAACST